MTHNPIVDYLHQLLSSGTITKEKICVACDLHYPSFDNIFYRARVSFGMRKAFQYAGIVPKEVFDEYDLWLRTEYLPRRKKNASKKPGRRRRKSSSQSERIEKNGDGARAV